MRVTGYCLIVLGLVFGIFSVVVSSGPQLGESNTPLGEGATPSSWVIPLIASLGSIIIGGAMALFGGRGYIISRNPAVRN